MYDVLIIGAGVVGTSAARELSKYKLRIGIVDKCSDVSDGTSKANSGIIHAGYDAPFDKLTGKLNARGNKMFDQVSKELNVEVKRIGSLVLAFDDEDVETLDRLLENGKKLDIPNLKIIGRNDILSMEPNINPDVIAALYAPSAGIIEPWELAIAYAENAVDNGAELILDFEVDDISKDNGYFTVKSAGRDLRSKVVVNAAGIYGDDIHALIGTPDYKITARRGEYYVLDQNAKGLVHHVIFPCPSSKGKGTLLVPTVEGNILVGPNSENLSSGAKEDTNTTLGGLDEVLSLAGNLCPDIPLAMNIRTFAGLRAISTRDDFIIEETEVENFINAVGIKSPGLSSIPAIAEMVEKIVIDKFDDLALNEEYNPVRRERVRYHKLPVEERQRLLEEDAKYGNVVCRCELVTEKEIVDSIHRSAGARTLNGVKRRVRPGSGRCQGGFCSPIVLDILKRELNLKATEVLNENKGSNIITGYTKNEE